MQTSFATLFAAALMATGTLATHELGSNCKAANENTMGCSNDECSVLKCVAKGNDAYYWSFDSSCIGMKCENGACDSNFPKSSCTA